MRLLDKIKSLFSDVKQIRKDMDDMVIFKAELNSIKSLCAETRARLINIENKENLFFDRTKSAESMYGIEAYIQNDFLMKNNPEQVLKSDYYKKSSMLMDLLKVYRIVDEHSWLHIGSNGDGGYVIVNDLNKYESKVLYGFGVSDDVSFEEYFADKGFEIFLYDHTVAAPPIEHPRFHFNKFGVIGKKDINQPELKTIEEIIRDNNHVDCKNIFLKCDIEGYEIGVLNSIEEDNLNKFTQIVFELHYLTDIDKLDEIIAALSKLNKTHRLVHVHINNCSRATYIGDLMVSDAIEVTYVRASDYEFEPMNSYVSGQFDYKNFYHRPERIFAYSR